MTPRVTSSSVSGRDYLQVKWRLVWLRSDHPQAIIETELQSLDGGMAVFKARVRTPDGGEATGWGSETSTDFGDFIEKAETKALGRALAALGYGLQFCEDFESPAEPHRSGGTAGKVTSSQLRAIYAIGRSAGLSVEDVDGRCRLEHSTRPPSALSRREASEWIDALKALTPRRESSAVA